MTDTPKEIRELFIFEEKAGRLELIIRIVYSILVGIVLCVYGILAFICTVILFFYVLIFGKRQTGLSGFIRGYLEYYVHVLPYTSLMTDTRPGIMPKPVKIFEEE